MKKIILSLLLSLFCFSHAATATDYETNALEDMFVWWNGMMETETTFTTDGFAKHFTDDAEIVVNGKSVMKGLDSMVARFTKIQADTDYVEIAVPFKETFIKGDKIFTYHMEHGRETGSKDTQTSNVMGYAILENGKIAYINFLSVPVKK